MCLSVLEIHDASAARFSGESMCELALLQSNIYITNFALKRSNNGYLAHKHVRRCEE